MPAEQIESMTSAELRSFVTRMEQALAVLRTTEIALADSPSIWVFRKRSLELGLERMEAAVPEFQRSANATIAGQPYGPDTQKGRDAKKAAATKKTGGPKKTAKKAPSKKLR